MRSFLPGVFAIVFLPIIGACSQADTDWQKNSFFTPWRQGSHTVSEYEHSSKTAYLSCLGTAVELENNQWPRLLRRPIPWRSIQRKERGSHRDWNIAFGLGRVRIADSEPNGFEILRKDFSGAELEYTGSAGRHLRMWVSRTTPAIVLGSDASQIELFAGEGPHPIGFVSQIAGRVIKGAPDEISELNGKLKAGSWMLVWFGNVADSSRFSIYFPMEYKADCPMLVFFGSAPESVRMDDGLKVDFGIGSGAGRIAVMPLYGANYPLSEENGQLPGGTPNVGHGRYRGELTKYAIPSEEFTTARWSEAIGPEVLEQCRWWARHLHEVPVGAEESYSYNFRADEVTIREDFQWLKLTKGGERFAPLPPMLAIAAEYGFDADFSAEIVKTDLVTAHGPICGIENAGSYTWSMKGVNRYIEQENHSASGAPAKLVAELEREVEKVLEAGILAPWYPVLDDFGAGYKGYYSRGYRGHFLWGNPAENIYYLAEAYPFLNDQLQERVVEYLKNLRAEYPPEELHLLRLGEGAARERYLPTPQNVTERQNQFFANSNWYLRNDMIPSENVYFLSRYYALKGTGKPNAEQWVHIRRVMQPYLASIDWGTMGFCRRPVTWYGRQGMGGVIDINNWYSSLAGAVRLARLVGDSANEQMYCGLLAKTAALRVAMGKYTRFLYDSGLLNSPEQKDWMFDLMAGSWKGYLYSADWSGPDDDVCTVWQMDQFGCYAQESRSTVYLFVAMPGLLQFINGTPELGRLFADYLKPETRALFKRVNETMPAWWTMYCPAVQTAETNFQPPEDAHQLFMLRAWVLDEEPERLSWLRDVSWLQRGDMFYIHKLAETIAAYGRN